MHLLIDLTPYQDGSAPDALALAQALARDPGSHTVGVALSSRHAAGIEALRHAFADLLPRERLHVIALPAGVPAWLQDASAAIRKHALAVTGADLVLVPEAGLDLAQVHAELAARASRSQRSATRWLHDLSDVGPSSTAGAAAASPAPMSASGAAASRTDMAMLPADARPRLAYISPLPPARSGIADYSAELIAELRQRYELELVVAQDEVSDARLAGLPLRSVAWFEAHADEFERVLYHFGNSGVHQHMFGLVERHPGIVVLHDFFLSGVIDNMERGGEYPQAYLRALYDSHGYTALLEHRAIGRNPSIWKYPANKRVLDSASGVIVHSDFSRRLADQWYGEGYAANWQTVPLLRGKDGSSGADARARARLALSLAPDDYVICSFGMLGRTKLNEVLLDAFLQSALAQDAHCRLVFVGENDPSIYGRDLERAIAASPAAERVTITGFVSAADYTHWLAACDCAVQLRSQTRGETSASVLDCLLHGLPTIVNAHGSTADLPDTVLRMLPDQLDAVQLRAALEQLHGDADARARLSAAALAYMQAQHTPAHVGALYADAIEAITQRSPRRHYRALLADLAQLPGYPDEATLAAAAAAIAANQPATAPRQMLVDVSALVQTDLRTGIQRVVRSILLSLIAAPPPGFRIEPVYSHGANRSYQYARAFTLGMVGETGIEMEDAPIAVRAGDVFLGLDLFTNGTSQNRVLLQDMRDRGLLIYFVVFDILPMLRPDVFPFGTEQHFGAYLNTIAQVADGLVCISRAVADELCGWLATQAPRRAAPLQVGHFHLGADIDASAPTFGLPPDADHVLAALAARPSFLMVGTVEPRKGHAQALAAFEQLWEQGEDANLVIVGKQGWMVDAVCERLRNHPERAQRLFWLQGISDEMLLKLYQATSALLAPSEGEGFGLPLIEAAQHATPIVARALPVFREVAGEHAYYFEGMQASDLAAALRAWLELHRAGKAPASTGMSWLNWGQSAQQLMAAVVGEKWYRRWPEAAA